MKILYVENHAQFARVAVSSLLKEHEVQVVSNVATAQSALRDQPFDALLVNYDLEDGTGEEIVRLAAGLNPRPFIVAVSAHETGNAALQAAGADAVCLKLRFSRIPEILQQLQR